MQAETRRTFQHALLAMAAAALTSCASGPAREGPKAIADLQPTTGNTAAGTVTFTQLGGKVLVVADIHGLRPNTEHGFHVHEKGDCSSGDGNSAGGHFNPFGKPHAHGTTERHAGDMPSLWADAIGHAVYKGELDVMSVSDGPASIVGKGLIIHRDPDDYKTQPTGNSGARIACAVIQKSS